MHPVVENRLAELGSLCARFHVRRLALFGSATGERFDPRESDIGLLVEFDALAPGQYAETPTSA